MRRSVRCQQNAGETTIPQPPPQAQHRVIVADVHHLDDHPIRLTQGDFGAGCHQMSREARGSSRAPS